MRRQIKGLEKERHRGLEVLGLPAVLRELFERLLVQATAIQDRLQELLPKIRSEFAADFAAWTGRPASEAGVPARREEDAHSARDFRLGALAAIVLEGVLGTVFRTFFGGLSPVTVLTIAVISSAALDRVLRVRLRDARSPRETLRFVQNWVIRPSGALLLLSLALIALARTSTGDLAIQMMRVFGPAIWASTVSCIVLAAGLMTAAWRYDWSARHSARYEETQTLLARIIAFIAQLVRDLSDLGSPNSDNA